jgi:hypothetical protein
MAPSPGAVGVVQHRQVLVRPAQQRRVTGMVGVPVEYLAVDAVPSSLPQHNTYGCSAPTGFVR